MINKVLDIDFSDIEQRVVQDETQLICEGEEDTLKLLQLLQDGNIKGTERQSLKQIAYPYLYGKEGVGIVCMEEPQEELITYTMGRAAGKSQLYMHCLKKRRSEGRLKTFQYLFGTRYKYIPVKIKKGAGKGGYRLQRVVKDALV